MSKLSDFIGWGSIVPPYEELLKLEVLETLSFTTSGAYTSPRDAILAVAIRGATGGGGGSGASGGRDGESGGSGGQTWVGYSANSRFVVLGGGGGAFGWGLGGRGDPVNYGRVSEVSLKDIVWAPTDSSFNPYPPYSARGGYGGGSVAERAGGHGGGFISTCFFMRVEANNELVITVGAGGAPGEVFTSGGRGTRGEVTLTLLEP